MLRDAWALAIEGLCLIDQKQISERLALTRAARELAIENSSTRGLAHKLVMETVRRQNFLDYLVTYASTPNFIKESDPKVRAFLRLYTFQTKMGEGSNYEKAASIAKIGRSILGWRRMKRAEEALGKILGLEPKDVLKDLKDTQKKAFETFQPPFFVKYCFKLLGRRTALQYFNSMLSSPPTYVRINTLKMSEEELLEKMHDEGVTLEKVEALSHTYKVAKAVQPLVRTSSFKDGLFYIQDKASCLASEVAAPRSGMTLIDACAAPGAKTTYFAQLMENRGTILSIDYSKRRFKVWKREIERMGVEIASPIIADTYNPLPIGNVKADIVFLDPPCTSTGVFSRLPSAKWRLTRRLIKHMVDIQWKMLNSCAKFVKEGGSLVYSTCSITLEENENLIERFLRWHLDFTLEDAKPRLGCSGLRGQIHSQRLYPHLHKCNGFFVAKLKACTK